LPEEEHRENDCQTVTVYLCGCKGEISDRIDFEAIAKRISLLPDTRVVFRHDALCTSEGRAFVKENSGKNATSRVVIGACSPEVLETPLTQDLGDVGVNKYLVDQVDLREQCAWVHSNVGEASAKATALIRGAIQRALAQEPLEDMTFAVEGAALVVGVGEAGLIAAQRIAASGFNVYLVDVPDKITSDDTAHDTSKADSSCKSHTETDSKGCLTPPSIETLGNTEGVKLFLTSEIESINGGVGRWHVTVRTQEGKEEFDVGTILITALPPSRASDLVIVSAEPGRPAPAEAGGELTASAPGKGPSEDTKGILQMLRIGRGEDMTVRHLLSRRLPDLNRGVFVLESSLGLESAISALEDAASAADISIDIMRRKTTSIPRIIARVEEYRCRGCGKCADVCEYDAVTLVERDGGIRVAHIDESRCEGCGLCRVACCNGSMALLGYTTTQLLANMMGVIEEMSP
jgi:heterodisulfide reductase subunit A-like polyferredoxin